MDYHTNYNDYITDHPKQFGSYEPDNDRVVLTGTWILVLILVAIPIVNIIVLLVLAFGSYNSNLKSFAKASLILAAIGLFFTLLISECSY